MIDNLIHNAFFSLLRSGLWNISVDKRYFPLSDSHWLEIFQIARKQTVEAIVYDGIMNLPIELFPKKELIYKWTVAIDVIERQNLLMNQRLSELVSFFSEKGLKPSLLKGQSVAQCYDNPNHRVCGDIDLYFQDKRDYKAANSLISEKRISIHKTPGFSTEYRWKEIQVEHHRKLLDIHNPLAINRLKNQLESELNKPAKINIHGQEILTPSPLITTLVVNTHILKHSLSFGIGLRQLCDSARICYKYKDKTDGERIRRLYEDIGMLRWIDILNQILVDYLGLAPHYLPFELRRTDNPNWMLNEIMESGNFGFGDKRFGNNRHPQEKRMKSAKQLFHRFRLNFRYAPGEAILFPIVQVSSRMANCF